MCYCFMALSYCPCELAVYLASCFNSTFRSHRGWYYIQRACPILGPIGYIQCRLVRAISMHDCTQSSTPPLLLLRGATLASGPLPTLPGDAIGPFGGVDPLSFPLGSFAVSRARLRTLRTWCLPSLLVGTPAGSLVRRTLSFTIVAQNWPLALTGHSDR